MRTTGGISTPQVPILAFLLGILLTLSSFTIGVCQDTETAFNNLGPYVPTPLEVVRKMLRFADVKPNDVVYDVGCGDGRIVITAAKEFGAKAIGIEINPFLVTEALENVKEEKVEDRVTIIEQDALTSDFSSATVITIYLLPEGNLKLKPIFEKYLKPGVRVIFHNFEMVGWKAKKIGFITDYNGFGHTLHLCVIGQQK